MHLPYRVLLDRLQLPEEGDDQRQSSVSCDLSHIHALCQHASHQALRAVLALYTHSHRCPGHVDVHIGLLLGVVAALHGGPPQLVVCRDTDQPIRLRLPDRQGAELALGVLDACSLLCSQRVPIIVDPTGQ